MYTLVRFERFLNSNKDSSFQISKSPPQGTAFVSSSYQGSVEAESELNIVL